jgi:endonuclease G
MIRSIGLGLSLLFSLNALAQALLPSTNIGTLYFHAAYCFSYVEEHEQPEWTFHMVCRDCYGEEKRKNNFRPDPIVKTGSAELLDYKGSGFDRGHLVPAGDMTQSEYIMSESFFMSNMSPQNPSFNRGIWRKLESQIRKWSIVEDTIFVVTGPVFDPDGPSIGENKVAIPKAYYKALYFKSSNKMYAFLLPNEGSANALSTFQISIDELEFLVGIDFFQSLPDTLENSLESNLTELEM